MTVRPFTVRPVVSWPRRAGISGRYLMTVDLEPEVHAPPWPYEQEEIVVHCVVDAAPLFSCQAVDDAAVVLHRFGGTYGPARYVLTAAKRPITGEIHLTLLNDAGVPVDTFTFDGIEVVSEASAADVALRVPRPLAARAPWHGDVGAHAALVRIEAAPVEEGAGYRLRLFMDAGELATEAIGAEDAEPAIGLALDTQDARRASDAAESLGALLARGAVGAALIGRLDEGAALFLDVEPGRLERVPWEIARVGGQELGWDARWRFARVHAFDPARWPEADRTPLLRVLVISGVDPASANGDLQASAATIEDALGIGPLVDVEVLDRPDRLTLTTSIRELRPDVIHLTPDIAADGDGMRMDTRDGAWIWDVAALATDLRDCRPQVVVVEADAATASSMPRRLIDAGAPGVVAIDRRAPGVDRAVFVRSLYREFERGAALDAAVAEARRAVRTRGEPDAGPPATLTVALPPARVVGRHFAVPRDQVGRVMGSPSAVHTFVGRTHERRRLWRAVYEDARPGRAVAVTGSPGSGKTWLLKWCVTVGALNGANTAYADCDVGATLDFLEVLRLIAGALEASPVHGSSNAAALSQFSDAIDDVVGRREDEELGPLRRRGGFRAGAEHGVARLFDAFTGAMRVAGHEGAVVVALDGVEGIEPSHWQSYLVPHLVVPAATGSLPLRLLLADGSRAVPSTHLEQIELHAIPPEQYLPLVRRYLQAQGFRPEDFMQVLEAVSEARQGAWQPGELRMWDQLSTLFTNATSR